MEIYHKVTIVGLVLLLIGGALVIAAVLTVFPDPSREAEWDGSFGYGGGSSVVDLDGGSYDVWVSDTSGTVTVTVETDRGDEIFDGSTSDSSENINVNGKDYYKVGTLRVSGGTYTVESDGESDVYITRPIDTFSAFATICGTVVIAVVGLIMLVIGGVQWFIKYLKGEPEPIRYHHEPRRPPYAPRRGPDPYRRSHPGDRTYRDGEYPMQDDYRRSRRPPPRHR